VANTEPQLRSSLQRPQRNPNGSPPDRKGKRVPPAGPAMLITPADVEADLVWAAAKALRGHPLELKDVHLRVQVLELLKKDKQSAWRKGAPNNGETRAEASIIRKISAKSFWRLFLLRSLSV